MPQETSKLLQQSTLFGQPWDRVVKEVPGHEQLFVLMGMPTHELGGEEGGDLGVRMVESSAPTAETRSMITITDNWFSLPVMALHL